MQELNQKILAELEKNSRATNIEIAKKLGVSEGTVRQRVQKLVKAGIIKRFTVDISTKTGFSAFVLLSTKSEVSTGKIVEAMGKINGVKRIYEVAGVKDVIVEVSTFSAEQFNNIVEMIRKINGVVSTESLVVLKVS